MQVSGRRVVSSVQLQVLKPHPTNNPFRTPHGLHRYCQLKVITVAPTGRKIINPPIKALHNMILRAQLLSCVRPIRHFWAVATRLHGIFQVRILERVIIFLLQGLFPTQGSNTCLLVSLALQPDSLCAEPSGKPIQQDSTHFYMLSPFSSLPNHSALMIQNCPYIPFQSAVGSVPSSLLPSHPGIRFPLFCSP